MYRDFSWGDASASVTTGTGMPIYFKGNYMTAARVSYGVQSRDNLTWVFPWATATPSTPWAISSGIPNPGS